MTSYILIFPNLFFRFSVGMGFCAVYGALLTKTNRISRIFHSASQSARRPSYISPRSQLIITAVLVSVQFLATLLWLVASIPAPEKVYPVPRTQEVIINYFFRRLIYKSLKKKVQFWEKIDLVLTWNLGFWMCYREKSILHNAFLNFFETFLAYFMIFLIVE